MNTLSPAILDILKRFNRDKVNFNANANISAHISGADLEVVENEVESTCRLLLSSLLIDVDTDPNSKDTPRRLAHMFVHELFAGRYEPMPRMTEFPNDVHLDELYIDGPISVTSMCSHHFMPVIGKVWIGILPDPEGDVLGLSKFSRIAQWVFSRPTMQEASSIQLADEIEKLCKPRGLGIIVDAEHQCCTQRGVRDKDSRMTTSVMRGELRESPALKNEFLSLLGLRGR